MTSLNRLGVHFQSTGVVKYAGELTDGSRYAYLMSSNNHKTGRMPLGLHSSKVYITA